MTDAARHGRRTRRRRDGSVRAARTGLLSAGAVCAGFLGTVVAPAAGPFSPEAAPCTAGAVSSPADETVAFTDRERRRILALSPLPPAPADPTNAVADDPAAARLGQALFFEERFALNGDVSCATCHQPDRAFTDGKPTAEAIDVGDRHTPGLLDVAHNRWFFWDGRADTLWAQAIEPIENPIEYGGNRMRTVRVVGEDTDLRASYEAVFGPMPDFGDRSRFPDDARPVRDDPEHPHDAAWRRMTPEDRAAVDHVYSNLGKSIAAYERRLTGGPAPFDVFVAGLRTGDETAMSALSPAAQRGLALFTGKANCRSCHFGATLSDGEFHSTGVPPRGGGPLHDAARYDGVPLVQSNPFNAAGPFSDARDGASADKVRAVVRSPETWGQFKTPSLRNVAETAPYMHQGQFATLEEVIRHYSTLEDAVLPSHHREQLLKPLNLTEGEIADLAAFLRSLSGPGPDPALLAPPEKR